VNGKFCVSPSSGTGQGAVRYILGYSLASKEKADETALSERHDAFHTLLQESLSRDDFGVGRVWKPEVGRENGRPAAVLAKNVSSFATADMEMDAYAAIAKRAGVKEPTMHLVYSFHPDETKRLSHEQMIRAAETAVDRMGLGKHAAVLSLHMDTDHGHVHVAISAINPDTLLSWERNRDRFRMSWASREAELEHGLGHDRGLAMVREDPDGRKRIEWRTVAESRAWKREDQERRLDQLVRRSVGDYAGYESEKSWAESIVAELNEKADAVRDAGLEPTWADAHLVATTSNARIRREVDGEGVERYYLDLYERVPDVERPSDMRPDEHGEEVEVEGLRVRPAGVSVQISRGDLPPSPNYLDVDAAEDDLAARIKADPSLVSRTLDGVEGRGTFTRADVDRYLAARITEPERIEALANLIETADHTIELVSADTCNPLFVRTETKALESRVAQRARMMTRERNDYDEVAMDRAIARFEEGAGYKISDEQRCLVQSAAQHRLSWNNGEAGSGKTTSMRVLALYCEGTKREIIGLATSEAAARKLGSDAGIKTYNLAKAIVEEERGNSVIPDRAMILLDESSMASYKALDKVTYLCESRNASVAGIGDSAQIQNIEGGSPHDVLREIAADGGAYAELQEVRRQKGALEWMRPVVHETGEAIRTGDAEGVERFVDALDKHGILHASGDRDDTIKAAVAWYLESPENSILAAKDRRTAHHVNDDIRRELGLEGTGQTFSLGRTGRETREISVGDRIQFQKNNGKLGIVNNDTASVEAIEYDKKSTTWTVEVRMDDGRAVSFDPFKYRNVEYGYCVTAHKSQGQDRLRAGAIWDKSIDANTAHVNVTRATNEAKVFYSKTNFETVDALKQHVGERIQTKDDVLLLDRIIEKTGGPDTPWAQNVRAAMGKEADPLRMRYAREMRSLSERNTEKKTKVHREASERMRTAQTAAEMKAVERWHRKASSDVGRENAAVPTFAEWAIKHKKAIEHDLARERTVERDRARVKPEWKRRPRFEPQAAPGI
jgi:hypothetical protein